ncbi:MAG: exodeoxyribonuclease III [Spirochaetaceae bacterium]
MKIISWNVNGIRAAEKKGLFTWLEECGADIVCLQETKAQPQQLDEKFTPEGWNVTWASAERKGYSGTVIYSRRQPDSTGILDVPEFDAEGRTVIHKYGKTNLINCYFPNSQSEGARLDYKLGFNRALHEKANSLVEQGEDVIICGDFNVAHKPIDLTHPKNNEKNPGYLPEEREWMSQFLDSGYKDTFRMFHSEPENYTWWSYRMNARAKNVGWRIDYFCVNDNYSDKVTEALIQPEVMGSDHCPILLEVKDL